MPEQYHGSCRCGSVRYTLTSRPHGLSYCHCRTCQKQSSTGAMCFCDVDRSSFRLDPPRQQPDWQTPLPQLDDADAKPGAALTRVHVTPEAERAFCSVCGSPVYMDYHGQEVIGVAAASLEDMPADIKVRRHIFLREQAPWDTLPEDGADRWDGMPDGFV